MPKTMPRFPILTYQQLMSDGYFKAFPAMEDAPDLPAEYHGAAALLLEHHHSDDISVTSAHEGRDMVITEHHVRGRSYTFRWGDDITDRQLRRVEVITGMSSPRQSQAVPTDQRQVMLAWMLSSWFRLVSVEPAQPRLQQAS